MFTTEVDLSWLLSPHLGLIILDARSPIIYSSQCGGTACTHPLERGHYLPLPLHWMPEEDPLVDKWSREGDYVLPWKDGRYYIQNFLDSTDWLQTMFEPREAVEYGEAWVPVRVRALATGAEHVKPFVGKAGIIVYPNSD